MTGQDNVAAGASQSFQPEDPRWTPTCHWDLSSKAAGDQIVPTRYLSLVVFRQMAVAFMVVIRAKPGKTARRIRELGFDPSSNRHSSRTKHTLSDFKAPTRRFRGERSSALTADIRFVGCGCEWSRRPLRTQDSFIQHVSDVREYHQRNQRRAILCGVLSCRSFKVAASARQWNAVEVPSARAEWKEKCQEQEKGRAKGKWGTRKKLENRMRGCFLEGSNKNRNSLPRACCYLISFAEKRSSHEKGYPGTASGQ